MKKAILTRLAILGVSSLCAMPAIGQSTQERIDATKDAVSDYVFLRQQIAEAKNEWRVYQDVAQRRIDFFTQEIERLEEEIAESEKTRSSAETVIAEKRSTISSLEAANNVVLSAMPDLEARVAALSEFFPRPLKDKVSPLLNQLGKPRQAAQRMAIVIGILNEVDKFNSEWSGGSEQVGNSFVDTIYMGLAGGFYANKDGTSGGYLIPAQGGWEKVEDNSIAPQVARAVKFFNKEVKPAELVPLPLEARNIDTGL